MAPIRKTYSKRSAEFPPSLSSIHTHTPPTHYRSDIFQVLVPVLVFMVLVLSSCYTQLHPPVPTRPPVAGTTDSLQTPQSATADTVYHIYEPSPFAPYYYRRYDRWNHYYNTPWWYSSRYYNNYYYRYPHYTYPHTYTPSGGGSGTPSKPAEEKPTNRRRRLRLNDSSPSTKPAQQPTAPAVTNEQPEKKTDPPEQSDDDEDKQDSQSNRRRKLDF